MKFDNVVDVHPVQAGQKIRRYTPTASPMVVAATWLMLALMSGFVVWLAVGLISIGTELGPRPARFCGGVSILMVWFSFTWRYLVRPILAGLGDVDIDDLFFHIEKVTQIDVNQDGMIGAPEQVTEIHCKPSESTEWIDRLPAPKPVLYDWAIAALNNYSLGFETWEGRFDSGRGDGRERYRAFRIALQNRGLANEHGTHSVKLTTRGIQEFTGMLENGVEPRQLVDAPQLAESETG